jgi:hypothetical protein
MVGQQNRKIAAAGDDAQLFPGPSHHGQSCGMQMGRFASARMNSTISMTSGVLA